MIRLKIFTGKGRANMQASFVLRMEGIAPLDGAVAEATQGHKRKDHDYDCRIADIMICLRGTQRCIKLLHRGLLLGPALKAAERPEADLEEPEEGHCGYEEGNAAEQS